MAPAAIIADGGWRHRHRDHLGAMRTVDNWFALDRADFNCVEKLARCGVWPRKAGRRPARRHPQPLCGPALRHPAGRTVVECLLPPIAHWGHERCSRRRQSALINLRGRWRGLTSWPTQQPGVKLQVLAARDLASNHGGEAEPNHGAEFGFRISDKPAPDPPKTELRPAAPGRPFLRRFATRPGLL